MVWWCWDLRWVFFVVGLLMFLEILDLQESLVISLIADEESWDEKIQETINIDSHIVGEYLTTDLLWSILKSALAVR